MPRSSRGGIYRVVCELFEVLAHDRHVELQAALVTASGDESDFLFSGKHVVVAGTFPRKFVALWRLAGGYDLIHLHGFTPWQALACWLARKKMVYTNHGLLGTGRPLAPHEHVKLVLMKLFLRHAVHRIIHVSQFMQQRMTQEYGVSLAKSVVVHNCTRWQAQPPRFEPGAVWRLGFHGRFVSVKRIDRLLVVAALVSRQRTVEVVLVGEGPLQSKLEKQAGALGVMLHFVPYCAAAATAVSNFDVEIISSRDEALGLSALEAIQAGHPTFVFADGGGLLEIFAGCAEWFVCRDETEMSQKILRLADAEQRRQALRGLRRLQQRVNTRFSPQTFAAGYRRQYFATAGRQRSEAAA
ncbi:MAG: glycosyltransferase family 4 protein [candidate division KSB1 bacterium]|nr:glycosyltransferase family 4 protein [candidate division KSB1 bacterium]MDZ7276100.1 glycosyltransferase family 4 protein [candidate division KSB1 bacterium]MDZ7287120.1 glycosyltransferase family 4 protein [candidate division KSB1 bacterium]MDZ7296955.1 glycosyltransferase family 4 protein [candidate division KSB1 bacterium]MDZ7307153.1 glycosyltransferase family 4 protein [candidate division KSB1 bacterium]